MEKLEYNLKEIWENWIESLSRIEGELYPLVLWERLIQKIKVNKKITVYYDVRGESHLIVLGDKKEIKSFINNIKIKMKKINNILARTINHIDRVIEE